MEYGHEPRKERSRTSDPEALLCYQQWLKLIDRYEGHKNFNVHLQKFLDDLRAQSRFCKYLFANRQRHKGKEQFVTLYVFNDGSSLIYTHYYKDGKSLNRRVIFSTSGMRTRGRYEEATVDQVNRLPRYFVPKCAQKFYQVEDVY